MHTECTHYMCFMPIAISRVIKQKLRNARIPTLFDNQKRFSECTQMLLKYQQHIKFLKSGDYFLFQPKYRSYI